LVHYIFDDKFLSATTTYLPGMFSFRHPWLAYFWHRKLNYQYERECYPFQSERENKKIKKMLSNLWKIIIYMYNIKIICPLKKLFKCMALCMAFRNLHHLVHIFDTHAPSSSIQTSNITQHSAQTWPICRFNIMQHCSINVGLI
jgi:hypothetical protein